MPRIGRPPGKTYDASFHLRIRQQAHDHIAEEAARTGQTFSAVVRRYIQFAIDAQNANQTTNGR